VQVVRVNLEERKIDFELAGESQAAKPKRLSQREKLAKGQIEDGRRKPHGKGGRSGKSGAQSAGDKAASGRRKSSRKPHKKH